MLKPSNVGRTAALALSLIACASAPTRSLDQRMAPVDGSRWFAGSYEVTCDRTAVQGEQTLTVFSVGASDEQALREARRNAVRALVFRGVRTAQCGVEALMKPDAFSAKADAYFDDFFKEGGQYLSYVDFAGDEVESRVVVGRQVKIASTVVVHFARLRADLERAGVIQSMSGVFRRPPPRF